MQTEQLQSAGHFSDSVFACTKLNIYSILHIITTAFHYDVNIISLWGLLGDIFMQFSHAYTFTLHLMKFYEH